MAKEIKTLSISWKNKPEESVFTKQLAAIYKSYKAKITLGIITSDDVCLSISRLVYNMLLEYNSIYPQKSGGLLINKFMGINVEIDESQEGYYIAFKPIKQEEYHSCCRAELDKQFREAFKEYYSKTGKEQNQWMK